MKLITSSLLALASFSGLVAPVAGQDFIEVANATGSFTELFGLIDSAGLDQLFALIPGDITIFAPVDGSLENSPLDLTGELDPTVATSILSYHAVLGNVLSTDLTTGPVVTVSGDSIDVVVGDDGTVTLNGGQAVVTLPDIVGEGGVVHGISGKSLEVH